MNEQIYSHEQPVSSPGNLFTGRNRVYVFVVLALLILGSIFIFWENGTFSIKTQYSQIYTLVNDKVSVSAPIQIHLPKGVSKDGVEQNIVFDPILEGEWVNAGIASVVVFKPFKKLEAGKYYTIALTTANGEIKKDFQADDDPAIVDIFPKAGSEADESSAITIVFNRPMVPLTALSELEKNDVPVVITPVTEGKFKWISTRNLQFIPKTTLIRSTQYAVKVNPGFTSMDGLPIKGLIHNFTTRPLRFESSTNGMVRYNQPIEFRFNQPVNLEKTTREILLKNLTTNRSVSFDAKYGSRLVYSRESKKNIAVEDRSVISILPRKDKFGRANLWDFENNYLITLSKAYPIGGDIILSGVIQSSVTASGIIQTVTARSDRTDLASLNLFDPQGEVIISFYEDVDIDKSSISAKGLQKIKYGQRCKTESGEQSRSSNTSCEKENDKTTLVFSFDANRISSNGESVPINLKSIVNSEGFTLNTQEVMVHLTTYPKLEITKINRESISELILCTNSPLKSQTGEAFHNAIKADQYIVLGRWNNAYVQSVQSSQYHPYPYSSCAIGEYVNVIRYGLLPEKTYTLNLSLADVFGQTIQKQISFVSEAAAVFHMRFHALDKIYNVTTPGKTKLTYAVENFDQVNVHICKTDPLSMIRYLDNHPDDTVSGSNLTCIDSRNDVIDIPPRMWVNNYFQIDLAKYFPDTRGQYIFTFTNPKYRNYDGNQKYERTYMSVTNLAVAEKKIDWTKYDTLLPQITKKIVDETNSVGELYWVNRIGTLAPEVGATVQVISDPGYSGSVPEIAQSSITDVSGIAVFPLIKDIVGAVVKSESDTAIVSSWTDTINGSRGRGAYSDNKVYLYTDRPIYRPGQKVYVKGLYRFHFDGAYQFDTDVPVTIKVTNSKGDVIHNQIVSVSKYGTFNIDLKLPSTAALGRYHISALNQYAYFSVEEYASAAFEAKADTQKDEYTAGEDVEIDISGKYYFGVPVDGGTVEYSFTAQNYYFDRYTDEYFNFGKGWYGCSDCGYGDNYIKSGRAILDADGRAKIVQQMDFNLLFKEGGRDSSKIIVFHATVKDGQGKSISVQKSFIVHRGDFYLGVKTDPYFTGVNQPFALRLKTVDTEGSPVRESGISITVSRVKWESFKRREVDGSYYNRTERTLTPVITKKVSTDGKGDYKDTFKIELPGEYDISAVATDSRGNTIEARGYMYVYGEGSVSVRETNNATLDITAERTDLNVGDTAKIVFQSPYRYAKALITLERGRIFDYRVVDVNQNVYKYEFPILSKFVPNVFASVLLLSPDPEVKFGQVQFKINRKEKELNINVTTDKSSYLPGERVTLKINTTDVAGRRVPAEVSVAVADLSVLALKGNPKKDPLVFFYNGFPLAVSTATNIKNILTEAQIPTGTKGGDGGNPSDLAKKQRGEFKDTAFWGAQIETDAKGEATVSFILPDNLTRWQIESLGITEDSKVGVAYREITAQKKIMLVPLRPRFVVPGDEFEIGAQVFNQTDQAQNVAVSYESTTLDVISGSKSKSKTLKSGESSTMYFSVKAPESQASGAHIVTLSAKSSEFEDTVQNMIPIHANLTYESVASSNATEAKTAKEYIFVPEGVLKDRGGLTVKASATLAIFLSDALKYLIQFPYGCGEQLASKLSSIAIVKKGLNVKNVGDTFNIPPVQFNGNTYTTDDVIAIGLAKIYDVQTIEGGFSYYKGLPADGYLTINIVNALKDIEEAGYDVDKRILQSAVHYLSETLLLEEGSMFPTGVVRRHDINMLISGAYAISRVENSSTALALLKKKIILYADNSFVNEKASSMTLGYLALLATREQWPDQFIRSVYASLENRADIDSRGAYVKLNAENIVWQYYETPIKATALFLKAIVADKRNYSQTDKLLRWLLASRSADGAWGSTQNTLSVIDAFTEYLSWKKETESDFSLNLALDGTTIKTFDFSKKTIFSMFEKFLPMASFETNTMHTILFEKKNRNDLANSFYYDLGFTYYLPAEQVSPRDEGITIERNFYNLLDTQEKNPVVDAKIGEVLRGTLHIITGKPRHLFAVEDFIPAGFELVNFSLATEDSAMLESKTRGDEYFAFKNDLHPDFEELHDDRLFLFKQELSAGEYTYEYYIRATTPGTFRHLPAVASELYFPENFGRTGGSLFRVSR